MQVTGFRHIGIPTQDMEASVKFYEKCGFVIMSQGVDIINGQEIRWKKIKNDEGNCIELLTSGHFHLAFTVDEVKKDQYYFQTPAGHKVQFGFDPAGVLIEFVEEPKNGA